ncbi:maleylpyruvate isomerase [Streptomyces sp. 1114.5]|uniref:maleylpyruvate isomerase family mycothiol-dependent enzyme n=1 Tax=unclassified Streptomyces TaxID=2593676 RepID=UPI000BCA14EA|nr:MULTISPECIES: maleylpyruvate isomerase family mycothiol-dependent enzyme [unclassified Streptomyces]RKT11053.1 maleylpyruvate isomerase [Streptomyces sp. 1114.5]SOB81607.1 maleylpyruvate isomerase [Streptomyces sp. 1331.2]
MTDPQSAATAAASWLGQVEESTRRLLDTVSGLKPEAVAEPSALPGWTRGHVLAHLARNADSLVNLLTGARTGTDIPQYASNEARDAEIDRDAPRPLEVHLADLHASHQRFAEAAALLADESWTAEIRHRTGYLFPAHDIPHKRLLELEYHHVDLDAGHSPAQWPQDFAVAQFRKLAANLAGADLPAAELVAEDTEDRAVIGSGAPALTVTGPVRALTAWLSGRSDGTDLRRTPDAALPQLPPMG